MTERSQTMPEPPTPKRERGEMPFSFDRFYRINRKAIIWIIVFAMIYILRDFFTLIFLTFIIGFFGLPLAGVLERRLRFSRTFAIILVYAVMFVGYVALYWFSLPTLMNQVSSTKENLPQIEASLNGIRDEYAQRYPSVAGLLGLSPGAALLKEGDVLNWPGFLESLKTGGASAAPTPGRRVMELLPREERSLIAAGDFQAALSRPYEPNREIETRTIKALNESVIRRRDFHRSWDFADIDLRQDELARRLLARERREMSQGDIERLNRHLLELAFPQHILPNLNTEDKLEGLIAKYEGQLTEYMPRLMTDLGRFFITSILALVFSFAIALDYPRLVRWVKGLESSNLHDFYEEAGEPFVNFAVAMGRGFRARFIISAFNAVAMLIVFILLGIPSVALLTVITFVTSFIPVIGTVLHTLPIALVALNAHGVTTAGWALGAVGVLHAVDTYMLTPWVFGREFKMNLVAILFLLYIGHEMAGAWGMILGVPIAGYILHDVLRMPVLEDEDHGKGPGGGEAEVPHHAAGAEIGAAEIAIAGPEGDC